MPRVERIVDALDHTLPLRVTRGKGRKKTSKNHATSPTTRVKCGCCDEAIVICHSEEITGGPSNQFLEIGGVNGTIDQWRQVLAPLLGLKRERVEENGEVTFVWRNQLLA